MKTLAQFALVTLVLLSIARSGLAGGPNQAPIRDSQRVMQTRVKTWTDFRDDHVIKQKRDYSCGAAALATIAHYYWGDDVTENDVLDVLEEYLTEELLADRVKNGLAISDLRLVAVKMGYVSTIGKLEIDKIREVKVPLIVALRLEEFDHFVVVRGFSDGWVYLADPGRGNIRITERKFQQQWIKNAVLVVAKKGQTGAKNSELSIGFEELTRGWLNDQVIRTFPEKVFTSPH